MCVAALFFGTQPANVKQVRACDPLPWLTRSPTYSLLPFIGYLYSGCTSRRTCQALENRAHGVLTRRSCPLTSSRDTHQVFRCVASMPVVTLSPLSLPRPSLARTVQLVFGSLAAAGAMKPFDLVIPKLFAGINTYVSRAEEVRTSVHSQYKKAKTGLVRRRQELVRALSPRYKGREEEVKAAAVG